jgi:hypothetical protein
MKLSSVKNVALSFDGELESTELLTGTATGAEITTSTLTIASVAVNTAELEVLDVTTAIGKAVTLSLAATVVGKYRVNVTCDTDATPAQTLIGSFWIEVVAD